jgi:hypothetical protein
MTLFKASFVLLSALLLTACVEDDFYDNDVAHTTYYQEPPQFIHSHYETAQTPPAPSHFPVSTSFPPTTYYETQNTPPAPSYLSTQTPPAPPAANTTVYSTSSTPPAPGY